LLEITGILRSPLEAWNHKFNLIGVSLTKPSYITGQTIYACGGLTLYPEIRGYWASGRSK
jgi:hypothetical protein